MKLSALILVPLLSFSHAFAADTCVSSSGIRTPVGRLISRDCVDAEQRPTRESLLLEDRQLLAGQSLYLQGQDPSRLRWVYSGKPLAETGCADRLYLIDLSRSPPTVTEFGVAKACNVFEDASWGKSQSIITLQHGVHFKYRDGVFSLPAAGEKLWNSIEPPHAGSGLSLEDAVPFARNVPLPAGDAGH